MNNPVKTDILMAAYNGAKFIKEQIDSILSQTYSDFSLIIRDDGSDDDTQDILHSFEKLDKRVRIINDGLGNLGYVSNFERLLSNSGSDLIMFSDQDDIWFPDKIETYMEIIRDADMNAPLLLHSDCIVCSEDLRIIRKNYISSAAYQDSIKNMFFSFMVQGSTMMFNKALKEIFMPFLPETYLHDRYIHIMAELFGRRIFIPKTTMYYRQHKKNQIGSGASIKNKLIHKRYFDQRDRSLLEKIHKLYNDRMDENTKRLFDSYFFITDRANSRFRRLLKANRSGIRMHLFKKFFLLLKG